MATKIVSRENVLVILGLVMVVCLALTIVTFPVALIWVGQPLGNAARLRLMRVHLFSLWRFSQPSLLR